MRRRSFSLLAAGALLAISAAPVFAADEATETVMIMKHACTEADVRDQADFDAVAAPAEGDEITALALTVLACPTIVLAEDEDARTDGVAGPAVDFEFELTDSNGVTQTLADAEFMPAKLCESQIERDANGDGEFSPDVCLDISHYVFSNVALGEVEIVETSPPNGWKFGTILLTPAALQPEGSDDQATNADFDAETATITADLAGDQDTDLMLHVYNFEASPATDTLPVSAAPSIDPIIPVGAGLGLTLLGGGLILRRKLVA